MAIIWWKRNLKAFCKLVRINIIEQLLGFGESVDALFLRAKNPQPTLYEPLQWLGRKSCSSSGDYSAAD